MIKLLQALPIAIIANIIGGMVIGRMKFEFNKDKLVRGLLKGLGIYSMVGLYTLLGYILPEFMVDLNGTQVTIMDAITIMMYGFVGWYIVDGLKKFAKILPSSKEIQIDVIDEGVAEEQELG